MRLVRKDGHEEVDPEVVSIDEAITELSDALVAHGCLPLAPPNDLSDLEELIARVAPLTLPPTLFHFWTRVDAAALPFDVEFPFLTPRWSMQRLDLERELESATEEPYPDCLLPIAAADLGTLAIDLDHPTVGPGGVLFEYWHDEMSAEVADHTLEERIRRISKAFTEDPEPWFRHFAGRQPELTLSEEGQEVFDWSKREDVRHHPSYGTERHFDRHRAAWPARWLETSTPRGPFLNP